MHSLLYSFVSIEVIWFLFEMDVSPDVWGQLALEASQVYLTDGTAAKSPFAGTVS